MIKYSFYVHQLKIDKLIISALLRFQDSDSNSVSCIAQWWEHLSEIQEVSGANSDLGVLFSICMSYLVKYIVRDYIKLCYWLLTTHFFPPHGKLL